MSGHWWLHWLIAVLAGVAVLWLLLGIASAVTLPRGGMLSGVLRLLPDLLRLIPPLTADKTLPGGVRYPLGLLLAYLAMPIDLIPDFSPVLD